MTVMTIKKQDTKMCVTKGKIKTENYRNYLKSTQLDNKMKYLEKKQINIDNLRKSYKELIRNNNSILKAQQRFKSERHKCFYWRKLIKLL